MQEPTGATYLRDPQQTELGRRMLIESIRLIDAMGLEEFTFKRLATALQTAEASIYRYFENKHRLLLHLVSWYWQWLDAWVAATIDMAPTEAIALRRALAIVAHATPLQSDAPPHAEALYRIVVAEASKSYLTKAVDAENRAGLFLPYKSLCRRLADLVRTLNPNYPFPHALVSTLLETARKQTFFAQHLPSLTEVQHGVGEAQQVATFLDQIAFAAIGVSIPTASKA